MAYIYQITNDINGKIYIGKTYSSLKERFQEHCRDSRKERCEKRPLYTAMRKYGVEHFHIELIEETDNPEERERYWIETKGSFKNGYNATLGGDGKPYLDYDLVIATYKEIQSLKDTAIKLNISPDTVSKILKSRGERVRHSYEVQAQIINQYTLKGEFIQSFPSCGAAIRSLKPESFSLNGAASHIRDVCKGKRKTAYGYIWKFAKDV